MSDTFALGDVVQLKSGGEPMTVEKIDGANISCIFGGNKRDTFPAVVLQKYKKPGIGYASVRRV